MKLLWGFGGSSCQKVLNSKISIQHTASRREIICSFKVEASWVCLMQNRMGRLEDAKKEAVKELGELLTEAL